MKTADTPRDTPRHVTIVTGASRGLGRALAQQLLARGHHILTLQRNPDASLAAPGAALEQWSCDLSQPLEPARRLQAWVEALPRAGLASLTLINNAASLPTLAAVEAVDDAALSTALRSGLEAPLLLSRAFLAGSRGVAGPRRLLHISSGLGRRAMAGSAVYCAAKAGLDHLSRCIALEQAEQPDGARSVSLAPGVIDTDMQVQLRGADPARFSSRAQFVQLKDQQMLLSPQACAQKILAYLGRPDFGAQPVADIRDAA